MTDEITLMELCESNLTDAEYAEKQLALVKAMAAKAHVISGCVDRALDAVNRIKERSKQ